MTKSRKSYPDGNITFRHELSREYTVTLRGELGTHLEDNTHVYGMLEILGSEFKHGYQDNNFKTNNKKTTWGVGIGIGMRYPWTESRGFGIRYNYQMYDSYRTKDVDPNPTTTYFAKITPRYHTLMATVTLSLK